MRTVTVVGAGFSGLTLAFELRKRGFRVEVHERGESPGGLIGTHRTPYGIVETAANALLADERVESLFAELNLNVAERLRERKRRYLFWDKPRRWPLGFRDSLGLLWRAVQLTLGRRDLYPKVGESIAEWGRRFGGDDFVVRVLGPVLQGVYAGDPKRLSAVLLLKSMLGTERVPKGDLKGSIAPENGMGELISSLNEWLKQNGVIFHYESSYRLPQYQETPVAICTSAWAAADIVRDYRPDLAADLSRCESLALVSATCFFERSERDIVGFGCLFPKAQKFNSLGVLFNNCIFEGRSELRSETWILGGAGRADIVAYDDERILKLILEDRDRLGQDYVKPYHYQVTHWPRALPHYTVEWERILNGLKVRAPLYLHGNYLGQLGLARVYARSIALAQEIRESYV